MTQEDWYKKVLEARERFERGVMGPHPRVKITRKDLERVKRCLISQARRRFTVIK